MPTSERHERSGGGDPCLPEDEGPPREHPKELRTFILEVSAGRRRGVGDATDGAIRRVDIPNLPDVPDVFRPTEDEAESPASKGSATRRAPTPKFAPQVDRAVAVGSGDDAARAAQRGAASARRRSRGVQRSSLFASGLAHALIVALFASFGIAQLSPPDEIELSIGQPAVEEFDVTDVDLAADAALEEELVDELSELVDPGAADLGLASDAAALAALVDEPALTGASGPQAGAGEGLGDLGALLAEPEGRGAAPGGEGFGDAPLPEFFGARIEGRRIVFVLDNSGSMQGGRLETVIAELLRCVDSLEPDQFFYVAFYSDAVYPLFYPDPVAEYIRPTDRNKKLLAEWLETVELCLGDSVLDALNAAASIDPDTIILLSDGRIQGERKMAALLAGGGNFPLHTIGVGLGAGAVVSRRNLAEIAAANGGAFREAPVPDAMRELARRNPRPYHSEGPGPIWGRNVKARR